jgi:hypothetical protein
MCRFDGVIDFTSSGCTLGQRTCAPMGYPTAAILRPTYWNTHNPLSCATYLRRHDHLVTCPSKLLLLIDLPVKVALHALRPHA